MERVATCRLAKQCWLRYSWLKPEDICIWIRSPQIKVGNDLSRNDTKRNAITAVAEREIGMRKFRSLADVGQDVFGFTEWARPGV